MKRFRQRKAFTIVEMVIVIAVIAILATVLVPTISGVIQKANHSADTQFVASLNVQLALWQVDNGEIANESDLREAINYYYGEKDENGVLTKDHYATLSPKSAPQGYHYWWDAANKMVVLDTLDGLKDTDNDGNPDSITAAANDAGIVMLADVNGGSVLTFSPASPRSLVITADDGEEYNYFLMDQAGSDIAVALGLFADCTDGNYTTAVHTLENMEDALGAAVLAKVQDTAILNDHGMFVCGTDTVGYIYIPEGTQSLNAPSVSVYADGTLSSGSLTFEDVLSDDTLIDVPAGIKLYTRGAAFGEGITIFMNATLEEIKANGLIHAESTNCTIKLPDGNEYTVSGKKLMQDGSAVYSELPYTVPVDYVTVTLNNSFTAGNVKANITQNKLSSTTDGQLYIAYDFAGDLGFTYEAFDASGNPIPDAVTVSDSYAGWTKGTDKYTVTAGNDNITGTLTVTVQGEDFDVNVDRVCIQSIKVDSIGGKTPSDYTGTGYEYKAVYQFGYTSTSSFPVATTVSPENSYVDVDKTVAMVNDNYVAYTNGNLSVKTGVTNQRTTVTFSCGGKTATCDLNLVDNTNSPFRVAATATSAYMPSGVVYFGTSNAYLSQLFAKNDGVNIADQLVTYSFSINDWNSPTYKAADWTNTAMTFGNFGADSIKENVTVTIGVGGKTAEVTVNLVSGGYNVVDVEDWKDLPNSTSIVLLSDIVDINLDTNTFSYGEDQFAKNVGASTVYGNLHRIEVGSFYVRNSGNSIDNYFIKVTDGTVQDLILCGPVHGTIDWTSNSGGTYVHGISVTSGTATIKNSYISGFRAPVYVVNAPTLNVVNSTLRGGALANVAVKYGSGATLNFTNATLVQQEYVTDKVGAGIYLETSAKLVNINIDGTFKQYAYVDKDDLGNLADGAVSGAKSILTKNYSAYLHKNEYVNVFVVGPNDLADLILYKSNTFGTVNTVTAGYGYTNDTIKERKILGTYYYSTLVSNKSADSAWDGNYASDSSTKYTYETFLTDPIRYSTPGTE